jgi:hypothetical protein
VKNILTMKSWSPHGVGAAIGVLSGFTFLTVDHAPGITTAFEPTVAIAEREILPELGLDAGRRCFHRRVHQFNSVGRS